MKDVKILLTCIWKDDTEHEIAERMLSSFMPFCDGLAVAITGISGKHEKLVKLVKKHKGVYIITSPKTHPKIYSKDNDKYYFSNFAEARNVVFDLADKQKGYDWYTWADVDDILLSGNELRLVAKKAKLTEMDAVFFTYWYAIRLREDGTFSDQDVEIEHTRERLMRPHMFKWVSRLHEVAVPKDGNYKPKLTQYEYDPKIKQMCVWAHITDSDRVTANMERNTKILEMQIKEEERKDPRTIFYLAKTYFDMNNKVKDELAMFLLREYLEMSGWAEERANAWQYISKIYARRGDRQKAVDTLYESLKEFPNNHMTFLLLSKEYSEMGLHDKSDFYLETVLKMDPPKARTTIGNPLEVKYLAVSLKYNQCIRKVDLDGAIHWLKVRNELGQHADDGMIKTLEDARQLNQMGVAVFNYAKWLKDNGHINKIPALLESMPNDLGREPFAHYIANEVKEPKVWDSKSIVYYASWGTEHFEEWSPKSLEKGIGGSETAVIELARRWAQMGYKVTVFGDPRDNEGVYEGVEYRPWYEINWNDQFYTLILWRSPHLLDRNIKAYNLYMDLHDVASNLDWTPERVKKIDRVFFKSQFHRRMIPNLPDSKVAVISNGISC